MQGYATVPATSDAKEYLRLLLRHKFGLLLTLLLGLGLAWLYLISTDKVYETSALVEVNKPNNYFNSDGSANQTDWNAPTIKEEANLLRSRRVLSPVVDAFGLRTYAEAKRLPVLGAMSQRIPIMAELISNFSFAQKYAWGDATIDVSELTVPRRLEDSELTVTVLGPNEYSLSDENQVLIERARVGDQVAVEFSNQGPLVIQLSEIEAPTGVEFSVVRGSLQSTVTSLRADLSTETTDSKSRMVTVKLRGNDPEHIANLTNAILEEYTSVKLGSQNQSSDAKLEVYEEQLPRVEAELRAAEVALSEFRRSANSFNQDAQVNFKLAQLDKLETDLLEKEVERDDLLKRYTVNHPTPKRLQKAIDVLQDKIRQVRGTIRSAPNTQRELAILEDELETKRNLFIEISEELSKLQLANVGNVGEVQIIDDALPPRKPVSPSTLLAVAGGTLATLFLYTLYLTLRSALSTVISDQESLERASGLPVYMNIPKSSAQRRLGSPVTVDPRRLLPGSSDGGDSSKAISSNVLALSKPEDYSIENLRGLRSMLEDVMAEANNNVLMFTSPLPSMGKSFLSLNLAVLVAQTGKKVLLIDADYQRGQLHKSLGLPSGPGLPEVVRGKSELKETVKATSVPNLYLIARGYTGGSGSEIPSDKEFGAFLDVVAPRFDIAIIDTPPVLSVSTAASLGKHAGSTIMVVKEGEVKEPQLSEALKRLTFSGVRVSGCIMNSSSSPTPKHYTYYQEQLD